MIEETYPVFQALDRYSPLQADLQKHLARVLKQKAYPKGHVLLRPGQTPAHAWFIQQGAARSYAFHDHKGEQISTWFWYEGEFMLALDSFCRQLPTALYIELLEDSVLHYISFETLEQTAALFPSFRHVERGIMEDCLARLYRHYHNRAHLPVKSRFEKLMLEQPQLFQIASIKDIASFLGMFPDTLSRLRAAR